MAFFKYNNGIDGFFTDTPNDSLMELLINKTRAAGHMLTFNEASADPIMIDPNLYAFYFGNCFSDVSKQVWQKICKASTFDKKKERGKNKMKSQKYCAETVKGVLRQYFIEHGHWPSQDEVRRSRELPSWTTVTKYCGLKTQWVQTIFDGVLPDAVKPTRAPVDDMGDYGSEAIVNYQDQGNHLVDLAGQTTDATIDDKIDGSTNGASMVEVIASSEPDVAEAAVSSESDTVEVATSLEPEVVEMTISPGLDTNPATDSQSCSPTEIELSITLPDRSRPIVVKLSF